MPKINEEALEGAIRKIRKLRLLDHTPIKDTAPPAVTFVAIMRQGLGGAYEDAAIDYVMRHVVRYYLDGCTAASPSSDEQIDAIRALVSLFDDQGAVIGDVGPAINRAYEVLSHAAEGAS